MHPSWSCSRLLPLSLLSVSLLVPASSFAQESGPIRLAANRVDPGSGSETDSGEPVSASVKKFYGMLEEARVAANQLERYSATLEKQVRLDGELCDPETIDVKVRQQPFAVYMKWQSDGKEALYAAGENEGKLVARPTRGLAALKGVWQLQPDAPKAMVGCRYPVTELGIHKMTQRVYDYYFEQYQNEISSCEVRQEQRDGRTIHVAELTFPSKDKAQYSISKYYFDAESKLLFGVELCEWNYEGEPAGIAEKFVYRDIDKQETPADAEFRVDHPQYSLVMDR